MNEKKKLLIFAHYYYPDVAATGQILKDQAEGMQDTFDVTVICVVPSYGGKIEEQYKTKKYYYETINGVKVVRVRVPEFEKTNKISRINNILAYFFGALCACAKAGKQDYVFTISQPPILGGFLGVLGKWMKGAKLIYCIQDFNPEQIMAVGYFKNRFLLNCMLLVDKISCRCSDLVITVGSDLVETLKKRFKGQKVPKHVMINNWINEQEIYPLPEDHEKVTEFRKKYGLEDKFVIMYSGNIGLYYDLEHLIRVMKQFRKGYTMKGEYEKGLRTADGREVVFAFVGAGSVKEKLEQYAQRHRFENIVFIPYQEKENLIYSLNAADVHWCVSAKGIKGVSCPSKAYGIMAVGKPILGVLEKDTEIRNIIEESGCGMCCSPEDYQGVAKLLLWYIENAGTAEMIALGNHGRMYLENNLTKDISIKKYTEAISSLS